MVVGCKQISVSMECVTVVKVILVHPVVRILGPAHDNEKQNWRILTNKDIFAIVKKKNLA
jgi:hypothetical protein